MSFESVQPLSPNGEEEDNWHRLRSELGETLGLDGPVPGPTLAAALADETYAGNLLASRRHPALLRRLIEAPPRPRHVAPPQLSGPALARKAALALGRWAATGFATVDPATRQRREAACLACPHRLAGPSPGLGKCALCGCPLGRKISMTSEVCPDAHTSNAGVTRWSEPAARVI
jgi:hypothetical protein